MSKALSKAFEYKVGGSLPITAPSYIVRQADQELYVGLKAGEFCTVLSSRQTGKTSLLVRILHRLQTDGIACAVIDLSAISQSASVEQWYASIVHHIATALPLKPDFDLLSWWNDQTGKPPGERLRQFIQTVLLEQITQPIVIFLDEIENTLRLGFQTEFFEILHSCYKQRHTTPAYQRLTWAIAGVGTIVDLLHTPTPWYPSRVIQLSAFQFHELQPLATGLTTVQQPDLMLKEILQWTGGQPFLTQKLCHLVQSRERCIPAGDEARFLKELIQTHVIHQWEIQDEPQHLRTIHDRLLNHPSARCWLTLYQKILQGQPVQLESADCARFLLTGLVKQQQTQWSVYNRIYAEIFNQSWVAEALETF